MPKPEIIAISKEVYAKLAYQRRRKASGNGWSKTHALNEFVLPQTTVDFFDCALVPGNIGASERLMPPI
jgi:hypothetical protein